MANCPLRISRDRRWSWESTTDDYSSFNPSNPEPTGVSVDGRPVQSSWWENLQRRQRSLKQVANQPLDGHHGRAIGKRWGGGKQAGLLGGMTPNHNFQNMLEQAVWDVEETLRCKPWRACIPIRAGVPSEEWSSPEAVRSSHAPSS